MADTLKDKLSKAAKPVTDYAKNLYAQGKALVQPIDKGTAQTLSINADQINKVKSAQPQPSQQAKPNSYKKGGMVKKGGQAKVHKGERVLTKKQTSKFNAKGGLSGLYGK